MIRVKICGITREEDAESAREAGADFLGLVFASSPREVDMQRANEIMNSVPDFSGWVGVFADECRERVASTARKLGLHYVQLHGDESPEDCQYLAQEGLEVIKARCIRDESSFGSVDSFHVPFILLDTYSPGERGGTGRPFDWALLKGRQFHTKVFLSGGLRPDTISQALRMFAPFAVDVSSGVEAAPGVKSPEKIQSFIRAVRESVEGAA